MASVNYKKELEDLVDIVVSERGSDIHFSVGSHPMIRVAGSLLPLVKKPVLTDEDAKGFLDALISDEQKQRFDKNQDVDFSYAASEGVRFRGNAFYQKNSISIALRYILNEIRTIEELNLPPILETFAQRNQGFFLCVGPVGQGKSTTCSND